MGSASLILTLVVILILSTTAYSSQDGVCNACNCQFNNVQILSQLIESQISTALAGVSGTGATYIRWGKSFCPGTSQLIYAGKAGGTFYNSRGGAAEKVCLPEDPDYLDGTAGYSVSSEMWGSEYEFYSGPHSHVLNYNVPCAVCYVSNKTAVIMIPAKTLCPSSWTREYYGYLTTEADSHHRSSFNCVDVSPDVVAGSGSHLNGALFYYTAATCNGLDCSPYEGNRILSCTVCTK